MSAEKTEGGYLDLGRGLGHLRLTPPRAFSCPNALKDCGSESNTPQYATPSPAGTSLQGFPYRDNLTGIIIPVRKSL